jgi:hypothetical protein
MVRKEITRLDKLSSLFVQAAKKCNWQDHIPGGMADKKKPCDFDKKQLQMGVKVEKEHTDDPKKALEISMDHLTEFPGEYYDALKAMEKKLEKKREKKQERKRERKKSASRGCPFCGFTGEPGGAIYDVTFPCPRCGKGGVQI